MDTKFCLIKLKEYHYDWKQDYHFTKIVNSHN